MGLLDRFAEMHIKRDKSGNEVFYPHGLLGKGYVLAKKEEKKRIRSFEKKSTIWTFMLVFSGITIGWVVPILLMIPFFGVYYFSLFKHIKKLEVSTLGPTLSERIKIYGNSTNIFFLLFLFIISFGFIYIIIFLIINDPNFEPGNNLIDLAAIIFLSGGVLLFGWMIYFKWVNKRRRSE